MDIPSIVEAESLAEDPYNASDPEHIKKAQKKSAHNKAKRLGVMQAILKDKDGREWLYDLIEGVQPYGVHIVPGDTHATYFNWGMQNAGKILTQEAMEFPDLYIMMCNEAKNRK